MLKLCVILFFLSLGCWASDDEAEGGVREASCYAKFIEELKAEIVEHVPELLRVLGSLRSELKALAEQNTLEGADLVLMTERIEKLEGQVRGLRWAPPELPEHFLTTAHLTVREASHDLKNALLIARLDTGEIRHASTEVERRLILASIDINLELAEECVGTIAHPTTSPKRLFSVRELFGDLEILLQGLPNRVLLASVRPDAGIAVRASRTQILRLVQNLVLNAAEAMTNGGQITLSAHIASPPVDSQKASEKTASDATPLASPETTVAVVKGVLVYPTRYVSIRVSDNGPGIEKRQISRMFVSHQSTKQSEGGVNPRGVGLSSVLSLALENNGFIEADSVLGVGTQIQAFFPLVNREMTEQMEQEIKVPSVPGQIVVIDDQRSIRVLVATVLKAKGLPVVTFSNALSALEFCRRHKADVRLILLDQHLNDGSSMESNVDDLIAEGVVAPIVASSGNETPGSVRVAASFPKPFSVEPFMVLLEKLSPSI